MEAPTEASGRNASPQPRRCGAASRRWSRSTGWQARQRRGSSSPASSRARRRRRSIRTADVQVTRQLNRPPSRPGWLMQLVDLGMPFGYGEQAPFLGRKISAIRLGTASDASSGAAADIPARLDATRFTRLGRAADSLLASLDGGIELAGGTAGHVYLGSRIIRGWAYELVLLVALVPFLVGSIDLFARSRRRRLPLPGAWRGLRTRFGLWLWFGLVVGLGALAGFFPRGSDIPPPPDSPADHGLARRRAARPRCARRVRVVAGAKSACPRDTRDTGRGARRLRRGAARARRRSDRDRADQPLRPALRRPLALRVALAAPGRTALGVGAGRALRDRPRRSRPRRRRDRDAARARAQRADVPALADDAGLYPVADGPRADCLGRGRGAARGARGRTLRTGGPASAAAESAARGRG